MHTYFLRFALSHFEFRIPELLAVCATLNYEIELPEEEDERDVSRPFMVVKLPDDEAARRVAGRCILVKAVYALWARAQSYPDLHAATLASRESSWSQYVESTSFRFAISAVHHTIPQARIRETMEGFKYMGLRGKIDMKNPEIVLAVWEEYEHRELLQRNRNEGDGEFRQVLFGRLISEGESRALISKFDIKKRVFYGNTSMDAEMSLLMANQAQAAPGKLVYDPFAGTGSMLYTTAHFGALVFGSDLDGRQMRGKDDSGPGIVRAAKQYNINSRLVGCATFDVTRNPWRRGGVFDAVITDPPYGVRAGAKRLGGRASRGPMRDGPILLEDGVEAHTLPTYIPPTHAYELSSLASDLVRLAHYLLVPGGRLVFFLPTVTDEYKDVDLPMCDGMELVANSLQDFGKWGRRLITMVKTTTNAVAAPDFGEEVEKGTTLLPGDYSPAHKDFRVKYFNKFAKND